MPEGLVGGSDMVAGEGWRSTFAPGRRRATMQYLRVRATPDPAAIPSLLSLLLDSPAVDEARLLEWNPGDSRGMLALFGVRGDREAVQAAVADDEELVTAAIAPAGPDRFYLLAVVDLEAGPMAARVADLATTDGMVVLKPVIYADGAVDARIVGEAEAVGAVVELMPSFVDVEVRSVGFGAGGLESAESTLSPRQREAVEAALTLGYYETPRRATHEDVADRLECAPSTASDHLRRAEAKLVRGSVGAPD